MSAREGKRIVEASMTPKQIESAQSLAREWVAQSREAKPSPVVAENKADDAGGKAARGKRKNSGKVKPVKTEAAK